MMKKLLKEAAKKAAKRQTMNRNSTMDKSESRAKPELSKRETQMALESQPQGGHYGGSKWGIFLRAPGVYFTLKQRCGSKLVPLATIADATFGLKSGCDKFFFPRDITDDAVKKHSDAVLFQRYGLKSKDTDKLRLIKAGDGSVHVLEKKYLEPEIHGLMDITQVMIDGRLLKRRVVMIPTRLPASAIYARRFVRWGEQEGYQDGETCQSRVTAKRKWYDLTGRKRGKVIWPKLQQYRHVVAHNPEGLICNCNLYDIFPLKGVDDKALCAVLNSTIVAMMKFLYGSQMGREANQVTEIFDVKMMLVPDVRGLPMKMKERLAASLTSIKARRTGQLLDVNSEEAGWTGELSLQERQDLDDLVLEVLGISDINERTAIRAELYKDITMLYRRLRAAEKKMQRYRSISARRGRVTPQSIADEIWMNLPEKPRVRTVLDFISEAGGRIVDLPAGRATILKADLFHGDQVQIGKVTLDFDGPQFSEVVRRVVDAGVSGRIRLPSSADNCEAAIVQTDTYVEELNDMFRKLVAAHTADEHMQRRVVQELWKRSSAAHRLRSQTMGYSKDRI